MSFSVARRPISKPDSSANSLTSSLVGPLPLALVIEPGFRWSSCGRQSPCVHNSECYDRYLIPVSGQMPLDPVCSGCGIVCDRLQRFGMDCLGYMGGVERSVRDDRLNQNSGYFYQESGWE